jgi:RNA processing factor Prp31
MTSPPYSIAVLMQKIDCIHNSAVMELMRGLRNQLTELITGLGAQELGPMSLGLSHSLSRYKLKFSPEKVSLNICAQFRAFLLSHYSLLNKPI